MQQSFGNQKEIQWRKLRIESFRNRSSEGTNLWVRFMRILFKNIELVQGDLSVAAHSSILLRNW